MQKKTVTTILLVAVLIIWGLLVYKVYNSLNSDHISERPLTIINIKKHIGCEDSYMLGEYSRDPFLSILIDTVTEREPAPVNTPLTKVVEKKPTQLPLYYGFIQGCNKKTALFKLNNKTFFVGEGDTFLSLKVKKISADSTLVFSDGKNTTIYINKKHNKRI